MGRFINADALLMQNSILGNNLYAYVNNNPINNVDPEGEFALTLGTIIVGGVLIASGFLYTPQGKSATAGVITGVYNVTVNVVETISSGAQALASKAKGKTKTSAKPKANSMPKVKYPGNDPTKSPGNDYEWKGKGSPESGKGNWHNSNNKSYLHPDLNHGEPIGPHWDYKGPEGKFRIFPDGTVKPK